MESKEREEPSPLFKAASVYVTDRGRVGGRAGTLALPSSQHA